MLQPNNFNGGIYYTFPVRQNHSYSFWGLASLSGGKDWIGANFASCSWAELHWDPAGTAPTAGNDYTAGQICKTDRCPGCEASDNWSRTFPTCCNQALSPSPKVQTVTADVTGNTLVIKVGNNYTTTTSTLTTGKLRMIDNGAVVGRVLDIAGAAVSGATVVLRRTGQPDQTTTTASDGYWEIDNAPVANGWTITASKPGYCTAAYPGTWNVTGTAPVDCDGLALTECAAPVFTTDPISQAVCSPATATPSTWTSADTVRIEFSTTDNCSIDRYEVAVDEGSYAAHTSPYDLDVSGLSDGEHAVHVKAIDAANNGRVADVMVYLDNAAPVVSVDSIIQNANDLITPPSTKNAVQGPAAITVTATDPNLSGSPTVTAVDSSSAAIALGEVNNLGEGQYQTSATIDADTANGLATVTVEASDAAGNSAMASAQFAVNKSQVTAGIQLEGVYAGTPEEPLTRCITFKLGGDGGARGPYTVRIPVESINGLGAVILTDIPNDAVWTKLSVKDKLHTMRATVVLIDPTGKKQFVPDTSGGPVVLFGGDLTNDNLVDILDFGAFIGEFGQRLDPPGCDWAGRHSDISGDGWVNSGDFSFIQISFLSGGDPDVGYAVAAAAVTRHTGGRSSVTVTEMRAAGIENAEAADLNRDGLVNTADVAIFMLSLGRR